MAKNQAEGFFKQCTVVIKHEGKTYRVFKGSVESVKRGLLKRSTRAAKEAEAKDVKDAKK